MTYAERRRKREAERVLARDATRLDPIRWAPAPVAAKLSRRELDPDYDTHRRRNRPLRRAFSGIHTQRDRQVLFEIGQSR